MSAETKKKYIEAVGRRKTSIARVRMTPGEKHSVTINGKSLNEYFKTKDLQATALESLTKSGIKADFKIEVKLIGGGISSQAEAMRHGIARVIIKNEPTLRGSLKKDGMLTRDPRAKERRKFGLKKARKAPQWSKR